MNKTKKFIIFITIALVSCVSAKAGFGFGPLVGLNVNELHFSGTELFDSGNRCGFTGGVTAEYILPAFGLGADISLLYSHMESTMEIADLSSEKVVRNFLMIPLHLKYKFSLPMVGSFLSPYIYTGPSVAFKFGTQDSYKNTKTTQWGWDLGIGLEFLKHIQLGAGYTFGINNVAKWTGVGEVVSDDIKVKNNYWTVSLAYLF
ncbi:MAG: porin family protein [Lepagella sp.]